MKFGGAAVSNIEQFPQIAEIILKRACHARIVVVVSAMGDTTDQLLSLARKVHPQPPLREQDMLVSVGERVSVALLAMALHLKKCEAISLTGSQSGIITTPDHSEARIVDVKPYRIKRHLEENRIVLVAGFQGVSTSGEITTLGRGGSDTTAVALGIALGAKVIEFYKDVPGICEEDPKANPAAAILERLTYQKALEIVEGGAQVLHPRSIKLAEKNFLNLQVRSFFDPEMCKNPGTLIGPCEQKIMSTCIYEE